MTVKEISSNPWTQQDPVDAFVFHAETEHPGVLEARKPAAVDRYYVDLTSSVLGATTVLLSIYQPGGLVLPLQSPVWQSWLPEVRARISGAESSSTVSQQITEIQQITNLTDQQVAAAFPGGISRETVNRWRNRPDSNLRPENLYRLGLLYELVRRMQDAAVDAAVWLHQPTDQSGDTPFDLICRGQLGVVRQGVERIIAGEDLADEPMTAVDLPREWDMAEDEEDDGEWIETGPEETVE
jgi:hypothetical protein